MARPVERACQSGAVPQEHSLIMNLVVYMQHIGETNWCVVCYVYGARWGSTRVMSAYKFISIFGVWYFDIWYVAAFTWSALFAVGPFLRNAYSSHNASCAQVRARNRRLSLLLTVDVPH